jgi:ureidoglycolate lyase
MPRIYAPTPLTRAAFHPFGDVIQEEGATAYSINAGATLRINDLCSVQTRARGHALVSFFRPLQTVSLPLKPGLLECHPLGSQAFIPRDFAPFVVAVAPPAPEPELDQLRVFLTDGVQGVNYAPGVWHLPLASFVIATFVIIDRGGPGENLREFDLSYNDLLIAA